jgi:hypothetical protein
MGRSQRHLLVQQNTTSAGELHAQGEIAPTVVMQVEPAALSKTAPHATTTSVALPVGPPGGPLQGSSMSGAIPLAAIPPEPPEPVDEAPVLSTIAPSTSLIQVGDLEVTITGTGFTAGSVLVWNGADDTCQFVDETTLTTIVKTDMASVASEVSVAVRNGAQASNALMFSFTEAEPEPDPQQERTFPIGPFPISKLEFTTGLNGVVVLLDENSMFREGDTVRIEATGLPQVNGDYEIGDIDHRQDGMISFFLPNIDIDAVLQGKGRVTIIDGA